MNTFIAVVDAGSFVGAMSATGLSKPAVSRHVAELETHLGIRLLHRTTRRLSLTAEGETYYQKCRDIMSSIQEAEAEVNKGRVQARGRLRVGAPQSFGLLHLATLWGAFTEQNPGVTLDINLSDRVVDLVEEGYDVAIRIARLPSSTLISRSLAKTRLILCASPEYLGCRGTPAIPADMGHHDTIAYTYLATGTEWQFKTSTGEQQSIQTHPRIIANSGDTCRCAALAGQGIILQPDFIVYEDIASGRLVRLLPDYTTTELTIFAVYPTRKLLPPKVRILVDFLVEALRKPSWAASQPI
jgi:DNA-binding transcriptional LysR family regulator